MTNPSPSATVVELIGNPRLGSRTRALADTVTTALLGRLGGRGLSLDGPTALELGEIVGISFSADSPAVGGGGGVADPFGLVRSARLLVVATPTYKGSYTGLLKVFLDRYGPNDLASTVAVGVAIAASEDHRRNVGAALNDVLLALGARVPVEAVALHESEVADADALVSAWSDKNVDAIAAALSDVDQRQ